MGIACNDPHGLIENIDLCVKTKSSRREWRAADELIDNL
jgi:hypothetical protein